MKPNKTTINFVNNETRLDSVKAKLKRKAKRQLNKLSRRKLEADNG